MIGIAREFVERKNIAGYEMGLVSCLGHGG
jgi:hypothetical protein